jgi:hypothetical protein
MVPVRLFLPVKEGRRGVGEWVVLLAVVAGCGNTTLDVFDPERGLVAHWALDETERGAIVLDSSGQGHHGTPSQPSPPTPSLSVPPVHFFNPRSLAFDGLTQLVEFGNPDTLNISGPITLCAWLNILAPDGSHNILVHGYQWSPDQEVALRLVAGNYQMASWDGVNHEAELPIPPEDVGVWVHLCGVFDGGAYRLFRNGILAASYSDATLPPHVDVPWALGARAAWMAMKPERFFAGLIDDVRIYARGLTAAEVMALYQR